MSSKLIIEIYLETDYSDIFGLILYGYKVIFFLGFIFKLIKNMWNKEI